MVAADMAGIQEVSDDQNAFVSRGLVRAAKDGGWVEQDAPVEQEEPKVGAGGEDLEFTYSPRSPIADKKEMEETSMTESWSPSNESAEGASEAAPADISGAEGEAEDSAKVSAQEQLGDNQASTADELTMFQRAFNFPGRPQPRLQKFVTLPVSPAAAKERLGAEESHDLEENKTPGEVQDVVSRAQWEIMEGRDEAVGVVSRTVTLPLPYMPAGEIKSARSDGVIDPAKESKLERLQRIQTQINTAYKPTKNSLRQAPRMKKAFTLPQPQTLPERVLISSDAPMPGSVHTLFHFLNFPPGH
jgi:hypothetical protein